ncbi:hypothetical protein MSC49_36340 [Methylosinus sp. C49]|nr:hypothetical protein MSC49_36340 [Methylosinus sp. C49]
MFDANDAFGLLRQVEVGDGADPASVAHLDDIEAAAPGRQDNDEQQAGHQPTS